MPSGTSAAPTPSTSFSTVSSPGANELVTVTSTDTGSGPSSTKGPAGSIVADAPWVSISVSSQTAPTGSPVTAPGPGITVVSPTPNSTASSYTVSEPLGPSNTQVSRAM